MGEHTFNHRQTKIEARELNTLMDEEKDEAIYQEVVQGLNLSSLNTDAIVVTVTNATVFLRGLIDDFDDFIKIEEFVAHVLGVLDIKNELQLRV